MNELERLNLCLISIKAQFQIVSICKPQNQNVVTNTNVTTNATLDYIKGLYALVCEEKKHFFQNELISATLPRHTSLPNEESGDEKSLLFKTNSFQDVKDLGRPQLNQVSANIFHSLKTTLGLLKQLANLDTNLLNQIRVIAHGFQGLLEDLSDRMEGLPAPKRTSLFSLSRCLQQLETNYERQYKKLYYPDNLPDWISGFIYKIRKSFRKTERLNEITFLMLLSAHENANDILRISAIIMMINKINELESSESKKTSVLKKILKNALEISNECQHPKIYSKIFDFCIDNEIKIPEHLSTFIKSNLKL